MMEEEYFISGYCRAMDASRMVTVETDGKNITDIACGYGSCPYEGECPVAAKIRQLMQA